MADKKIIDQIINKVLQVVTPDKIILFGSQSRGDAKEDSDYDILIIKDSIEDHRTMLRNLYKQMIGIEAGVDIILKTSDDLEKSKQRFVSVTKEALNEGIIIYE
jgi:predicted nucleotidyltransferase